VTPSTRSPRRRTQQERREATQSALLDAAIECLVIDGYAGTTTERVCERAGVTRGALAHHFGTMQVLMAGAVEHLSMRRAAELRAQVDELSEIGGDRVELAIDALWGSFSGPLFQAALELWVAARTDAQLRERLEPVERLVGRETHELARDLFGAEIAKTPGFSQKVNNAIALMRGIAVLRGNPASEAEVQRHWRAARTVIVDLFGGPTRGR